ncbi:membrane-bound transcription factor site-2 protease [Episyrphus balteatus]|uniref:membrane-bound transcription factor site-2 protease n=1 Tax=Episyrphus balteatus TaxID=286459 RepID=UPI0024852C7C|nr:membrane-bound transcription factor site-2 protease [Episyrphus balteatus]
MDPVIFFSIIIGIYFVAFFLDCFFKSCMHYPWEQFLTNTGLTVKFLRFKWYTTAFNRTIFKWGSAGNKFLTKWFTCGALVALAMLPLAFIILFMTIFNGHKRGDGGGSMTSSDVKVQILLPGFNLPLEEIGFYVCTLAISTVVHELGHALAAVIEDVPLNGFGFQVYFCIPLAHTDIASEQLNSLRWMKKLRILCGGIWHNIIFSAFCYLLFSSFGFLMTPIYSTNEGVFVTEVSAKSTLRGERGLQANDIITEINDCRVRDIDSWYDCLIQSLRTKPGYCVSSDFIRLNDESVEITHHGSDGVIQCCDAKNYAQCCFEYIDDLSNDGPIEIPQHVCLNIRLTIEDSYGFCSGVCDRGFCIRPLLKNTTTILSIRRRQKPDVIYMGHPGDVSKSIRISPFVPKSGIFQPQLADAFILFLKYNIVFSLGLALVNALPCFGMDGYHISSTIINSFLVNRIEERAKRETIVLLVTGMGTFLFVCAVFKVVWVSLIKNMF